MTIERLKQLRDFYQKQLDDYGKKAGAERLISKSKRLRDTVKEMSDVFRLRNR